MSATARDILHRLADLGAKVERRGDKLLLEAGTAPVPSHMLTMIREHKAEVLKAITEDADRGDFDERAALIEDGAKVLRAWAEGFARLDPDRPPRDVTAKRWCEIINGIGVFLDRWATQAVAMGWDAADIFGADAARPGVTWLNSGPLWSGDGARVVEVHPDRMVFEMQGGARLTHYRRPHMRLRALPWELAP
jgi:hypothetical protein